jgi:hypothetical protein
MTENTSKQEKSWPRGIIIAYVIFVTLTLGFVAFTFTVKFDLVVPDYYNQTLTYQEQINRKQNMSMLSEPVLVQVSGGQIEIRFPGEITGMQPSGSIELYRPSDASLDVIIPVLPDSIGIQYISTSGLQSGVWILKLTMVTPDKEYYGEYPVNLR